MTAIKNIAVMLPKRKRGVLVFMIVTWVKSLNLASHKWWRDAEGVQQSPETIRTDNRDRRRPDPTPSRALCFREIRTPNDSDFYSERARISWGPPYVLDDVKALVEKLAATSGNAFVISLCRTRAWRGSPVVRFGTRGKLPPETTTTFDKNGGKGATEVASHSPLGISVFG